MTGRRRFRHGAVQHSAARAQDAAVGRENVKRCVIFKTTFHKI